jgi:uncharacterized protein YbcV (DUF1398 family)
MQAVFNVFEARKWGAGVIHYFTTDKEYVSEYYGWKQGVSLSSRVKPRFTDKYNPPCYIFI